MTDLFTSLVAISQVGDIGDKPVPGTTPRVKKTFSAGRRLMAAKTPSLLAGLQAYWAMEANSNDSVGAHHGTDIGTISYGAGSGKMTNGMSITGTSSVIRLTDLTGLTGTTAFSVGGWVYPTGTGQRAIACVDAIDYPNNWGGWSLIYTGTVGMAVGKNLNTGYVSGVDYLTVTSTTTLSLSTWYHVLGTYDGVNIRIYINGTLEDTVPWLNGLGWAPTNYGRIGGQRTVVLGTPYDPYNAFGANPWEGYLDEIGIWNRALTGPEVSTLHNGGAGLSYPF